MYYTSDTAPNPKCWKYGNIMELYILRRERIQCEPEWCDRPNGHFSEKKKNKTVYIVCSYVKFSGKEAEQCCYFKQKVVLLCFCFDIFYYCLIKSGI